MYTSKIKNNLTKRITRYHPELSDLSLSVYHAFQVLHGAFERGNRLYICGNGGSHADAQHIVGELMKSFEIHRPLVGHLFETLQASGGEGSMLAESLTGSLPAIALGTNGALSSAVGNDQHQDVGFAQELSGLGVAGDVLLAISTSGTSKNTLNALRVAKALNMESIALTGADESPASALADVTIAVPATGSAPVQELHIVIYHALCAALESAFFGN